MRTRRSTARAVKLDETYVTPVETHNPIELHATVAQWDGESYTFYETTQAISNHQGTLMQMLGLPKEKVRVISRYLGSGFGGKLWMWPHSLLAAAATRHTGAAGEARAEPQDDVPERRASAGHAAARAPRRDAGRQAHVAAHDYVNHSAHRSTTTRKSCGEATPMLYSTPNLRVTSRHGEAQRRLADVDARTGRRAGPLRARIGDERTGASS